MSKERKSMLDLMLGVGRNIMLSQNQYSSWSTSRSEDLSLVIDYCKSTIFSQSKFHVHFSVFFLISKFITMKLLCVVPTALDLDFANIMNQTFSTLLVLWTFFLTDFRCSLISEAINLYHVNSRSAILLLRVCLDLVRKRLYSVVGVLALLRMEITWGSSRSDDGRNGFPISKGRITIGAASL